VMALVTTLATGPVLEALGEGRLRTG
jgi:hypothetical protein